MLYHLLYPLANHFIGFNVFRYVTFRSVYAAVTAFGLCLFLGKGVIERIRGLQLGEKIRNDGPASHSSKAGTPTMGGVLILLTLILSTLLLWVRWDSKLLWLASFPLFGSGHWVSLDDLIKLKGIGKSRGMSEQLEAYAPDDRGHPDRVYGYMYVLPDDFLLKTLLHHASFL